MTKRVAKIMIAVLLVAILCSVSIKSLATTFQYENVKVNDVTTSASDSTGAAESVNKMIGSILTVAQVIGVGVAVIMLIVLAIKYISAAPGDKADIKKHAVVYVVGAVVLFAASGILQIIKNFAKNVSASET